jgi:proline iminopeptidase
MSRPLIIGGLVLVGLIVAVSVFVWLQMQRPLYSPGMLREGKTEVSLVPPAQSTDGLWRMEPGIDLHHFAVGEGRNVLIVHGGPGYPYTQPWSGLHDLTASYRFHYYDQRGCGRSTRPVDAFVSKNMYTNMQTLERALGISAQIADIERIRQILGEDKLILIGHSFGGFLASLYAAEFPEHVEALVLLAPADVLVMPQESDGLFGAVRKRLPEDQLAAYDAYMAEYFDFKTLFTKSESELAALQNGFGRYYGAVLETALPPQGEPGGWMVWAMYLSMGRRHDYRDALASVSAPVLVIHAADDLQTESVSQMYADAFLNARVNVIDDAAHFAFIDQPEAFGALVGEFLTGLD